MKKLFTLVAALLLAATVWAQSSSPKMSYQAVIRNAANELVTNQTGITVEISIKEGDDVVYSETHTGVGTNQNGLVSLLIGKGTNPVGDLKDVDWTNATIETQISGVPGNGPVTATVPVTAVPYAIYADTANAVNPNSAVVTEIQGDITEIKENYLTKAGLCDSIKSCDKIKQMDNAITGNANAISAIDGRIKADSLEIVELYTTTMETVLGKIKSDSTALAGQISTNASSISTNASDITDIKENYLTKAGLCDSIKNCPTIQTIQKNISDLQNDSIKELKELIQEVSGDLSEYEIKNCDDVTACVNTALRNGASQTNDLIDSIVDGHIKLADSLATESYVTSALGSYVTSEALNTTLANYYTANKIDDTLKNYATINKELALTIKSLTNADSTKLLADTTLTIPEDFTLDADHLVKLYINGVYVGDNSDGVLVVTDNKKVKYVPAENGNYALKVGDRIKIIYWVKK